MAKELAAWLWVPVALKLSPGRRPVEHPPWSATRAFDTDPRFLAVDLAPQLLPETLQHALNYLLDYAIARPLLDARVWNDVTGVPAFPPAMLLQVVLCAYSQGTVSSRQIERVCQAHVMFIARGGDSAPHFTTIARFVSTLNDDIAHVFAAVLADCDQEGLSGREMCAIDGVTLPSHASTTAQWHARRCLFSPDSGRIAQAIGCGRRVAVEVACHWSKSRLTLSSAAAIILRRSAAAVS